MPPAAFGSAPIIHLSDFHSNLEKVSGKVARVSVADLLNMNIEFPISGMNKSIFILFQNMLKPTVRACWVVVLMQDGRADDGKFCKFNRWANYQGVYADMSGCSAA